MTATATAAASPITAPRLDAGLALLRVLVGATFAAHGAQKLFVFGLEGVTGAFTQMGIPLPGLAGPLVALVEFFGGIALAVGLLTRLAGLGLAITMLGALFFAHSGSGFFLPTGAEFALVMFAGAAALALTGPGALSIDQLIADRRGAATTASTA